MLIFSQRHALQGGRRSINARSIGARIAEKKVREGKDYPESPGGEGGTPHLKVVGMLVVSLRGVNFGFWSHLGCSGQNAIIFSREGLV